MCLEVGSRGSVNIRSDQHHRHSFTAGVAMVICVGEGSLIEQSICGNDRGSCLSGIEKAQKYLVFFYVVCGHG